MVLWKSSSFSSF